MQYCAYEKFINCMVCVNDLGSHYEKLVWLVTIIVLYYYETDFTLCTHSIGYVALQLARDVRDPVSQWRHTAADQFPVK